MARQIANNNNFAGKSKNENGAVKVTENKQNTKNEAKISQKKGKSFSFVEIILLIYFFALFLYTSFFTLQNITGDFSIRVLK